MPTSTVGRLSTRLINQKALMYMDDGVGEIVSNSIRAYIESESSGPSRRVAMCTRRPTMLLFGSGCRFL